MWAFWGTTFHLRFFNIGSPRKNILVRSKTHVASHFLRKKSKKNTSKTRYRCDLSWRIQFLCQNWGEKPGKLSIWAFLGTTFHRHFQYKVTPQKTLVRFKSCLVPHFTKEVKKSLTRPLILKSITTVSR